MPNKIAAETFASAFDKATEAQWRALVDKALKGADFDKRLVARTADGIAVKPLYTRSDELPEASVPGAAPFVRGRRGEVSGLGWEITSLVDAGDAAAANRAVMEDLEGGANAVLIQVAGPGRAGVAVSTSADWSTLLTGVYLDFATVEIRGGLVAHDAASALLKALPTLAGAAGRRNICVNLNPIGVFARFGTAGGDVVRVIADTVAAAKSWRAAEPAVRTVLADGTIYHEAGASEAQELAAMASTLIAYLRAFEGAGVGPGAALPQIAIHLAADADIFSTAAKLRAARLLVSRIADACGAGAAAAEVRLTAITSERMMARRDPWTNMLRTTVATAGAAFGGADAIVTLPFTHALGEADVFARRIARNTQIVAQEESGLGRVLDPVGGSWYVEKLTADIAREAWGLVQEIEGEGGIVKALRSGFVQGRIAAVVAQRAKAIATVRQELTGVSAFPLLGDDGVKVQARKAAAPLATAAEIEPLAPIRLGAAFEALRDAAEAAAPKPLVFLASLGTPADHTARSTWVRNLLASGGIGVTGGGDYSTVEAMSEAFGASGCKIAVIASSDGIYGRMAEPAALALKAIGAGHVAMAGRPGEAEVGYRSAGVDRFIFAGQDAIVTLRELQELAAGL